MDAGTGTAASVSTAGAIVSGLKKIIKPTHGHKQKHTLRANTFSHMHTHRDSRQGMWRCNIQEAAPIGFPTVGFYINAV